MRDVAKQAQVACSTVSKALRNDPSISPRVTAKIVSISKRLGYAPNPMVAALMAQLHGKRRRTDPPHIAWIDLWPRGQAAVSVPTWSEHLAGARERASELGYGVAVYEPVAENISPKRLRKILAARAQWGIIIPPVPESAMQYPIDIRSFAAVTIGTSLRAPLVHRVSHDHYSGIRLACDRLRAKGFKRIGLAISSAWNNRVDEKWYSGYLARQTGWPEDERLPPLVVDADGEARFRRWMAMERPDAVLAADPVIGLWVGQRRSVPKVVWLTLTDHRAKSYGIDQLPALAGRAAVDMVVGQIHRNERGTPPIPYTMLLAGKWVEA